MTNTVRFSYNLGDHGWAGFSLQVGASAAEVAEFGYCTDALGDLIRVASETLNGAVEARASFDGEPFEWRLILRRSDADAAEDLLDVRILTFNDIYGHAPDDDGGRLLSARCSIDDFASAIAAGSQAVLDQYGEEEYNRRWGPQWVFPVAALRSLQAALALPSADISHD